MYSIRSDILNSMNENRVWKSIYYKYYFTPTSYKYMKTISSFYFSLLFLNLEYYFLIDYYYYSLSGD